MVKEKKMRGARGKDEGMVKAKMVMRLRRKGVIWWVLKKWEVLGEKEREKKRVKEY